jgi:predicted flap endonuclease-1-like 5' DNA nuclease
MLYTLERVFALFVLAFVLGALVGWVAHHVLRCSSANHGAKAGRANTANTASTANGDKRAKRSKDSSNTDADASRDVTSRIEVRELRSRLAALEPVEQERDRLRRELAELRTRRAAEPELPAPAPPVVEPIADAQATMRADLEALRKMLSRYEATIGVQTATINRLQSHLDSEPANAPPPPDVESGAALLGRRFRLDDLAVVVGVTREIAQMFNEQGISTWWALANTDVSVLREVLADAGFDPRQYDPSSWPQQARLLAHGSWQQFVNLAQRLPRGR